MCMANKHVLLFFALACGTSVVSAQTLTPDVIASTGGYFANGTGSLSFTLGEPVIPTYGDGSNILTEGFQQTDYSFTAVDEITPANVGISVYPNPFASTFTIQNSGAKQLHAEIIDVTGKVILEKELTTQKTMVNLSNLSDALYFLRVYDETGTTVQTFKIEKSK